MNYIKPFYADAQRLNSILYFRYVSENGINFKFPFQEGTLNYIAPDVSEPAYPVTDIMTQATTDAEISADDQSFITGLLALQKTESEAIEAGWIPDLSNQAG